VTGAAQLYRAASSDRRERGRPPFYAQVEMATNSQQRPSRVVNKRTVIIAFKVLESIWHMASGSLNTSSFATFDAPKVELCTIAILEINAFGCIDYPALKPCLLHEFSRVSLICLTKL
jgi:hypothetical protein